ncbi:unnamed protein product [Cylicocyclus nassatus]|uniref:Uncharacterized protein n=1 Tax=Cylicocyclus nassatus TaxID=53992 RepID=A0AA36MGZ3_CYLNA|nr:unnamed protein product [Cylicocyclus nassatus]
MRSSSFVSVHPEPIWSSYRRAAVRTEAEPNCLASPRRRHPNSPALVSRSSRERIGSDSEQSAAENGRLDRLSAELTELRRLVKKKDKENTDLKRLVEEKDMVIDALLDRISRFRQHERLSDRRFTLEDDELPNRRSCSFSSVSSLSLSPYHSRQTIGHTLALTKASSSKRFRLSDLFRPPPAMVASGHTRRETSDEEEVEVHQLMVATNGDNIAGKSVDQEHGVVSLTPDTFIIEALSTRTQNTHPDWKPPLPPSYCLRMNRPEIIRRIEGRQAAIIAASALRHQVAEEKMMAARAVIQGKCSYKRARNSLSVDPTLVKAFPDADMVKLTKRRLRGTNIYRSGISEEQRRIDTAAAKIIARAFSESTRIAVLGGRSLI